MNEKIQERMKEREQKFMEIEFEKENLSSKLNDFEETNYILGVENDKLKTQINYLKNHIDQEKKQNDSLKNELRKLKEEIFEKNQREMEYNLSLEKANIEVSQLESYLNKTENILEVRKFLKRFNILQF